MMLSPQLSLLPTSFSWSVTIDTLLVSLFLFLIYVYLCFRKKAKVPTVFKTLNYHYLSVFPIRIQIPLRPDTMSYPGILTSSTLTFYPLFFVVLVFCLFVFLRNFSSAAKVDLHGTKV